MIFRWKRTAEQLQQERDRLQRTGADQAARIAELEQTLAAERAARAIGSEHFHVRGDPVTS